MPELNPLGLHFMDWWLVGTIAYIIGGMMGAVGVGVVCGGGKVALMAENERLKRSIAEMEQQRDYLPDSYSRISHESR
jgi:hypothetical protein